VQVGRALGTDDVGGHIQPDPCVDAAVTAMIALDVGVHHHYLVADEPGGLCPPVGDQGLGRGQFQLELLAQKPPDLVLDFPGFLPGPVKASTQSSA
jgi:hypothetical protein